MKNQRIIIIFLIMILFVSCKKHRENIIVGRWRYVNVEFPGEANTQIWEFTDFKELRIKDVTNYTDTTYRASVNYTLDKRTKLRLYRMDGSAYIEYYRITDLSRKVLVLEKMDGDNVGWRFEFERVE